MYYIGIILLLSFLIAIITIFLLKLIIKMFAYFFGIIKKEKPIDKKMIYRDIPCNNDIKIAYWLLYNYSEIMKKDLYNGLFSAYILLWYKKGAIDIIENPQRGIFEEDFSIEFKNDYNIYDRSEKALYSFLSNAAGYNKILEKREIKEYCSLGDNKNKLRDLLEFIYQEAEDVLVENNLLQVTPEKNIILLTLPKKYKMSDELKDEYQKLIGLENFLKDYSNMSEKQHIEVQLWEDYLIFANLLCMADKVKEQFKKISPDAVILNKVFNAKVEESITGVLGAYYKITKLGAMYYLFIFGIIIWLCIYSSLEENTLKVLKNVFLFALVFIFIIYPLIQYLMKVKKMSCKTKARVIQSTVYTSGKNRYVSDIVYEYTVDGIVYRNQVKYNNKLQRGDIIKIYYNKENPQISEDALKRNNYLTSILLALFFGIIYYL